jgi:diguanylate cyclase (GGDEF)-like protein
LKRETSQARRDPLTGVANTRAFMERSEIELARCRRNRCPITVSFVDIDNFKTINDTRGHVAGDRLLQLVAGNLKKNIRENDIVARMGGDEFMMLLPDTGEEAARRVIERVFSRLGAELKAEGFPVTFSAGVVTFSKTPENFEALVGRADNLMYDVKNSGKNGVRYAVV